MAEWEPPPLGVAPPGLKQETGVDVDKDSDEAGADDSYLEEEDGGDDFAVEEEEEELLLAPQTSWRWGKARAGEQPKPG